MTTFADRLTILRAKLEESAEGVWDDDVIRDDYNAGMRDLAAKCDPPEMVAEYKFNSAANTRTYALTASPTLHREPTILLRGRSKMYREKPEDWAGLDLSSTSTPVAYAVVGASLYLRPVPAVAASMTYWYKKWPTALTGTGSTVTLGDQYLPAVESYVLAKQYEQIGDFDSSQTYWNAYDRAVMDIRNQQEMSNMADDFREPMEAW